MTFCQSLICYLGTMISYGQNNKTIDNVSSYPSSGIDWPRVVRYLFCGDQGDQRGLDRRGKGMDWARILAYVTGTVDQELLARNEYLAAENRILKAQLKGRLMLSDADACPNLGCRGKILAAFIQRLVFAFRTRVRLRRAGVSVRGKYREGGREWATRCLQ